MIGSIDFGLVDCNLLMLPTNPPPRGRVAPRRGAGGADAQRGGAAHRRVHQPARHLLPRDGARRQLQLRRLQHRRHLLQVGRPHHQG